jgi:hypothetical protein
MIGKRVRISDASSFPEARGRLGTVKFKSSGSWWGVLVDGLPNPIEDQEQCYGFPHESLEIVAESGVPSQTKEK